MNYEEFRNEVKENIASHLPEKYEGADININEVIKNNDNHLFGLSIKREDSNIAPTIYLESFFEEFENGKPLEDILDLSASVKRKKLQVDQAVYNKDMAYDQLKLQIAGLFTKITNDLIRLKTASENAAMYQGAGALTLEEFHNGNMTIEDFAFTKAREDAAVSSYQNLQTTIITDILTLEIITHTPILTNATTEITLDDTVQKTEKQIARENKAVEKRIKKAASEEEKKLNALEKAEKKAEKAAAKTGKKANK